MVRPGETLAFDMRMRIDESQMICVDCGNALRVFPDGPHFVITRDMIDNLPLR